jgi:predicted O-methyltransferase YrrM
MLTQYLPVLRRLIRSVLKYGASRELARLDSSINGKLVRAAFQKALSADFAPDELVLISNVERIRQQMDRRTDRAADSFVMKDFGAGQQGEFSGSNFPEGRDVTRLIGQLSRESSVDPFWGGVLFFLIRELKPLRCLEMGGLVGISTGYLCAAIGLNHRDLDAEPRTSNSGMTGKYDARPSIFEDPAEDPAEDAAEHSTDDPAAGVVVTLEGDPTLSGIVQSNMVGLALSRYSKVINGRFADTLVSAAEANGPFDLAFIDGHHDGDATVAYFNTLKKYLTPGALVIFDDIAWSQGMRRAWKVVSTDPAVCLSVAANQFGIIRTQREGLSADGQSETIFAERFALRLV